MDWGRSSCPARCHGPAGSANLTTPAGVQEVLARSRTVFHTPNVLGALRDLRDTTATSLVIVSGCIEHQLRREGVEIKRQDKYRLVEMVIIDEAERLTTTALELVRDIFDRTGMGIILIGMPGMEKRMSRYPQLYSRVGFAHHYRPLQGNELTFVLTRHWRRLGLALDDADFTDVQAVAAIARITAATSGCCTACSSRSGASSRSTACRSSPKTWSRQPAARSSLAPHSARRTPPLTAEGHTKPSLFEERRVCANIHNLVAARERIV